MQTTRGAFRSSRGQEWTAERIERLGTDELRQLRENAEKLGATSVVELCDAALRTRATPAPKRRRNPT